ncbi:DUF4135 domain-containing protein, partial [Actinophytocola sp.]|uniref:DUF4135 domain-containing protein n=1 Tax=Actinophytocola sp. TaxID=1872138 RepID=UPI003D6C1B0D
MNADSTSDAAGQVERTVDAYLRPALDVLAAELDGVDGLAAGERAAVHAGAAAALRDTVRRKVIGVFPLEREAGDRDVLADRYPALVKRLGTGVDNRVAAAVAFARRFAADRTRLSELDGADPGTLDEASFGTEGSHRGQNAVLLRCARGRLVYHPRPVAVEHALAGFLARVLADEPDPIRVPRVVAMDGYGWAELVEHRYCTGEDELRRFHRDLGRWLAVLRLLGGIVPHEENLVAAGPVPVVTDCETLLTPRPSAAPSGHGAAVDRVRELVGAHPVGSLLGTGLVPGRPTGRGPSPEPVLGRYREHVAAAFTELTERLREYDRGGELAGWLAAFADTPVRAVVRDGGTYAELSRMLWHPESLRDQEPAVTRARNLLARDATDATAAPAAPGDPYVIAAEVAELLDGDVPCFTTTPALGMLLGPRGTTWGSRTDLVADALDRWRAADPAVDRRVIQAALASAYLDEGARQEGRLADVQRQQG